MRATVVVAVALLVVGVVAPFAAATPATDDPAASGSVAVQDDETNETANETAPGAKLAGVADVQGAEVEGEVEKRSFGLQVAAANSNASKASVVAQQTQNMETQLAQLQERKAELEAARENGTISESRFRAEMAGLAARISTLQQLTNATAETANGLPADALAERGVNASAIERLRTSAKNLSGPEVAAIARDVAGPPNGTVGPPANGGGPPFVTPGENNTTTGPSAGVGSGTSGNGPGNGTPGNGQTPASTQANTTTGPNNGTGTVPDQANTTTGTGTVPDQANTTTGTGTVPDQANTTTGPNNGPNASETVGNGTGVGDTVPGVAGNATENNGTADAGTETLAVLPASNELPAPTGEVLGASLFALEYGAPAADAV